jgi:hypothetical protein
MMTCEVKGAFGWLYLSAVAPASLPPELHTRVCLVHCGMKKNIVLFVQLRRDESLRFDELMSILQFIIVCSAAKCTALLVHQATLPSARCRDVPGP